MHKKVTTNFMNKTNGKQKNLVQFAAKSIFCAFVGKLKI